MKGKSVSRKPLVRGDAIIERTLDAVLVELGRNGYTSLSIEDVAERARVNKTTVYRRWPTKAALVRAALLSLAERHEGFEIPDTGSLRGDFLAVARRHMAILRSAEGRVLIRMLNADAPDPDLLVIARSLRTAHEVVPLAVLERAKRRGEIRADVDSRLIVELFHSGCTQAKSLSVTAATQMVRRLIDVLLVGCLKNDTRRNSKLR